VRVVVVHYEAAEAAALADRLRRDGIAAEPYTALGTRGFGELAAAPPDAILIDLMRMPSYGRAMGGMLRRTNRTRAIPIVFLEGDQEKTARVRELLPDAGFASLQRLAPALKRAVRSAPAKPIVPESREVPAGEKLRIPEGATVSLIGAPEGFEAALGGAKVSRSRDGQIVLLFARTAAAIGRELPALAKILPGRRLWVLWPKRTSRAAGDLSLPRIHDACAPLGLVAYKTCSVDATWSAAAVSRRRTPLETSCLSSPPSR
jgi:CheY-like chemotaxis protein